MVLKPYYIVNLRCELTRLFDGLTNVEPREVTFPKAGKSVKEAELHAMQIATKECTDDNPGWLCECEVGVAKVEYRGTVYRTTQPFGKAGFGTSAVKMTPELRAELEKNKK